MAAGQTVPSFDDIIQADRLRRKNEALANEIFGKGRRASTPSTGGKRKSGTGPSLASRVGVTKSSQRSASSTPKLRARLENEWTHDLYNENKSQASQLSRVVPGSTKARAATNRTPFLTTAQERLISGAVPTSRPGGHGMTIRGLAGPYVVMASNFAPGTTSADIESAMVPLGGEMQSCRIISAAPTVVAEMVFTDKGGAENVIATFNNQKADGRLLHVYMRTGAPTVAPTATTGEALVTAPPPQPTPPEPRLAQPAVAHAEHSYNGIATERNGRRAEPEFQDGSYGFEAREERMDIDVDERRDERRDKWRDDRRDDRPEDRRVERRDDRRIDPRELGRSRDYGGRGRDSRGLYSDTLYSRPRGRGFR